MQKIDAFLSKLILFTEDYLEVTETAKGCFIGYLDKF